ncbi:hypothetical protein NBRC116587_02070 [Pseudoteredinibacter isoporae]
MSSNIGINHTVAIVSLTEIVSLDMNFLVAADVRSIKWRKYEITIVYNDKKSNEIFRCLDDGSLVLNAWVCCG